MTEQKKLRINIYILITIAGWGVMFGVCKNQIATNARDIAHLKLTFQ